MRILYIAPYVPSRIRVRTFQIIRELSKRHIVHVIALRDSPDSRLPGLDEITGCVEHMEIAPHSDMRGIAQSFAALPTRTPMCAAFCRSGRMKRMVDEAVARRNIDLVHVEHLRAAHFAPSAHSVTAVMDAVDCLTSLFSQLARSNRRITGRMIAAEEAWKLGRYEPRMLKSFDRVVVTSDPDRDHLLCLDEDLPLEVVPNGVDPEYFSPKGGARKPTKLLFSGKMSYAPNVEAVLWFARYVLPNLREKYPELELAIVGSDPPAEVTQLAGIPGVSVTGYADDIRSHLDSCGISLAPMRTGVGVQNKVMEAMSMALPVVATPLAARAFGASCPGIVEADSAEDYIEQVSRLLDNPAQAAEIGLRGRQEVIARFSWQTSVNMLEAVYEDALRTFRSGRQIVKDTKECAVQE